MATTIDWTEIGIRLILTIIAGSLDWYQPNEKRTAGRVDRRSRTPDPLWSPTSPGSATSCKRISGLHATELFPSRGLCLDGLLDACRPRCQRRFSRASPGKTTHPLD
jgi:hypothetical protein